MPIDRLRKYACDLKTLPGDFRLALSVAGPRAAGDEVLERTLRRLWRRRRFLLIEQPLDAFRSREPPPGVEIRRIEEREVERLVELVSRRRLVGYRRALGCGRGAALANSAQIAAREHGYRATWRLVDPRNAPVLRIMRRNAGDSAHVVGELVYRRLLRRARMELRVAGERPACGLLHAGAVVGGPGEASG